jgi:hypothetical protein
MSHLRSPRVMIWPTLRAIEFPPWLAKEAHNWRTHAVAKARIFRLIEQGMADRPLGDLKELSTTKTNDINELLTIRLNGSDFWNHAGILGLASDPTAQSGTATAHR